MVSQRVPSDQARRRILDAARELLLDRPFAALTVGDVMAHAELTRTVFYRHFDTLAQMAPELLPDADDPLVDQVLRGSPDELIEALDGDPELAEAFQALTPGRQKSYMFNLNQARQSATRVARIERFREKIIAGKGAMEQ